MTHYRFEFVVLAIQAARLKTLLAAQRLFRDRSVTQLGQVNTAIKLLAANQLVVCAQVQEIDKRYREAVLTDLDLHHRLLGTASASRGARTFNSDAMDVSGCDLGNRDYGFGSFRVGVNSDR